ncbi:hypothetical protein [Pseudohongiella nitratireducens]|uniref:hypothetical protein n=1 Tax=Pseudohongiella nitratireducens TaxID=1768907 RepID=UPI0030EDB5BF|tara:strand:+ start:8341 stop:8901 length:561 start_codon:yes stop_codon:yes gene_type:complete
MNKSSRQTLDQTEVGNRSVIARIGYLESIIKSPADHQKNTALLIALKSQGGLAKLEIDEANISPMSLNTLKTKANDLLPNGFATIDHLRLEAMRAIQDSTVSERKSVSVTKQDLKDKIKAQEKTISQLWDEIALVTNVFRESVSLAQQFAEKGSDPADLSLFKKRRRELLSMLSFGKSPQTFSDEK